jgi:DNA-binding MarR family transcriptional regulator
MSDPDRPPSPCHCLNLRRAAQALTSFYDAGLEGSGLSLAQFSLLKHIQHLEPVNVSDLADAMSLDRTTLVRNLKPLEGQDLVRDLAPRRTRDRQLSLTPLGRRRFEAASAGWERAQEQVAQALTPEALARFEATLQVIQNLRP